MVSNQKEKANQNSNSEVLKHINIIEIIVAKYCRIGMIAFQDIKDYEQEIAERLIRRMPVIKKNFNGSVKFQTYLSVIINNACKELIRGNKITGRNNFQSRWIHIEGKTSVVKNLVFEDEMCRLQKIFKLFGRTRFKLEVSLKVYFAVDFSDNELNRLEPQMKDLLLEINYKNQKQIKEKRQRYEIITTFFNKFETRNNNSDAIRKWIKSRIEELIELLNGNPKRAEHSEETLGILLEKYYEGSEIDMLTTKNKDD